MNSPNKEDLLKHPLIVEIANNLEKEPFLNEFADFKNELILLSVFSNFLLNFSKRNPHILHDTLSKIQMPITEKDIFYFVNSYIEDLDSTQHTEAFMKAIRLSRKAALLGITLQDILGIVNLNHTMRSLTVLAECLLEETLAVAERICINRYGEPEGGVKLCIIGVGKLGAEELNYSSDIDIIAVYGNSEGKTSGVLAPSGVRVNRITNHEFYCKVIELLNKFLSIPTEDGIVYRVDLRLRPQGQRGPLAIGIRACREYYESWGRTWERMVMIRARPVAGDKTTGERFMEIIKSFVWQRAIDYSEIEEIKAMKKKIDSTFLRDDIKRGYGGIREAEFFIQTLQLMFSKDNLKLQTHKMERAVAELKKMAIIPQQDLEGIYETYLYLRRLEHYLQMKEDLQTHTLPKDEDELEILALKMGYKCRDEFLKDLRVKRMRVKSMYNILLGTEEDVHTEAMFLLTGELRDEEISEFLKLRGLKEPEKGVRAVRHIAEKMIQYSTEKQRKTAHQVVPLMVEECLRTFNPDRALTNLEQFLATFGMKEAYLAWFSDQMHICRGIIRMFAESRYLSRVFLSDHLLLDNLLEESLIRKSYRHMAEQLTRHLHLSSSDISKVLAEFRRFEEFRLGLYYLMDIIRTYDLFRYLSHLAEVEINACLGMTEAEESIVIVAMGKLGGREMTFGSDLDLLLVTEQHEDVKKAEATISMLTKYTDKGPPYSIDMRLRPDGSKGTLVKSLEGYRQYYIDDAQQWEIQALLKARPVAGPVEDRKRFFQMVREVIKSRAYKFNLEEIRIMRKKIVDEVSRKKGIDIKFGVGGIEEIEFFVQGLQIVNSIDYPELIVQNTETAIRRLAMYGVLKEADLKRLSDIYRLYRRVETLLRLNEHDTVEEGEETTELIARIMGLRNSEELVNRVGEATEQVMEVINKQAF